MLLSACPACDGFLPPGASACPNCAAPAASSAGRPGAASRLASGILAAATSALTAVTLMACYGQPPCDADDWVDADGDGASACRGGGDPRDGVEDCDDSNPEIHPVARDPRGDGVDQDCDGVDGEGGVCTAIDADGDGFRTCAGPGNLANNEEDCDDANPDVSPAAPEVSGDGIDQNCDGLDAPGGAGGSGGSGGAGSSGGAGGSGGTESSGGSGGS